MNKAFQKFYEDLKDSIGAKNTIGVMMVGGGLGIAMIGAGILLSKSPQPIFIINSLNERGLK